MLVFESSMHNYILRYKRNLFHVEKLKKMEIRLVFLADLAGASSLEVWEVYTFCL